MDRSTRWKPWPKERATSGVPLVVLIVLITALAFTASAMAAPTVQYGSDPASSPLRISDPSANPSWTALLNGAGTSADGATSALALSSGVCVGGWLGNAAGNWDASLTKYSPTGTVVWGPKTWDGSAHKNDVIWKIAKGPSGTIYAAGWTTAANDKTNMLALKWSSAGKLLWAKTYDGTVHGDDFAAALGVDKYGNVTVAGSSEGANGRDFTVVRWTASGARSLVWRYDGTAKLDDGATDVVVEANGTSYVTGNVKLSGPVDATYTVKFSLAGTKAWARTFKGALSLGANATSITSRPGGGVYIAGWQQDPVFAKDAVVVRFSSGGALTVLPPWQLGGDGAFADVTVSSTKQVVAVGTWDQMTSVGTFYVQYKADDSVMELGMGTGGAFNDAFTAVTADPFGGVYFTGNLGTSASQARILTNRRSLLAAPSGFSSAWGPALGNDRSAAIATYGTTVYVVGFSMTATEGFNQMILAYTY